jgi:hypothetical protein
MTLFSDVGQVQMQLERGKEEPHMHSTVSGFKFCYL